MPIAQKPIYATHMIYLCANYISNHATVFSISFRNASKAGLVLSRLIVPIRVVTFSHSETRLRHARI